MTTFDWREKTVQNIWNLVHFRPIITDNCLQTDFKQFGESGSQFYWMETKSKSWSLTLSFLFFFKNTFPFETLTFLQKWACRKEGSLKHFTFKKKFSGTTQFYWMETKSKSWSFLFFFKNTFPFETLTFLQKWACRKEGSLKHFTFKKKFSGTYHTICNSTIKLQERNIQFIINLPYENRV